ncbi:alpha-L-fucosidase [Niabella insulamsoli]|uniref:alpha-L-fucosidase n=1 Tax=Niabella insulamsoli TaxID=3144874 RepID=UPI0032029699
MKHFKMAALAAALLVSTATTAQLTGSAHRADWFKEAKFGMFIHWGLYSVLGGSYNGHTLPDTSFKNGKSWYAEWIQQRLEVPKNYYRSLVKEFNPTGFDADAWILEAKRAGMKYFVITAKHHDGFALWDSKVSNYDIASTPYKKDLLGALAQACKKYGLKYGFYYSHCEDWDHPGGATPHWTPQKTDAQFETYWREKCLPQVTELIDRYQPDLFWFDTWGDEQEKLFISDKRRDELIALIRAKSPKTLINGRISWLNPGNDIDFLEMMDNAYPTELQQRPWQTPATMVHSWGWHAKDYNWKSAAEMIGYLVGNVSKGGNYLLNIGPKPDGTFPAMAVRRLREMGGWMAANGDAVYGAQPIIDIKPPSEIRLTQKISNGDRFVFASIVKPLKETQLVLPIDFDNIVSCHMLDTKMPIRFKKTTEGKTEILLPKNVAAMNDGVPVIQLKIK